jgi:LPXTG-site transpeptidase (sortase) family protein
MHSDGSAGARARLGRGLVALGVVLGAVWLGAYALAAVDQARLSGKLRTLAGPSRPLPCAPVEVARTTRAEALVDGLVGRIQIPRLGMDAMVIEGADDGVLARGVGHIPHTAFPGERGNAGLAAHRDTFFRGLHDIAIGDRICVQTLDGLFESRVDRVRILAPDRDDVLGPTRRARLTLVTCYPFHWIGPAPMRFVVDAHAVETPLTTAWSAHHENEGADPLRGRPLALR